MKTPTYYACCGRRYDPVSEMDRDWRLCLLCRLNEAFQKLGHGPLWRIGKMVEKAKP